MRHGFVVTAIVCLLAFIPATLSAQTTHFRFVQDAEFASLSQSTGTSSFNLQVSRGLTTSAGATASLQYSAFSIAFDPVTGFPTSITFANEFGPIPPSTFTGQNVQNLALNIDTSTLDPTLFFNQSTTIDLTTGAVTTGTGPTGVINLQFTENDGQSTVIHALQQEVTNGPVTTRTHQRSDNSTANFQGSIFGSAFSGSNATVGVNHLSSVEMITSP